MRPYVIVNCAMSIDGKIALPTKVQTKISNAKDLCRVHQLRNKCDAILVGVNTILTDNPVLTVKRKYVKKPKNPVRIVLDSRGRIPGDVKVLDSKADTIIVTTEQCTRKIKGVEMIRCGEKKVDIEKLLPILYKKGIKRLLVEGGGAIIWSFLKGGLVDELSVFIGSMVIGGTSSPTMAGGEGAQSLGEVIPLKLKKFERLGDGVLLEYKVRG